MISSGRSTPTSRKAHKFFDSYPQYTRRPADLNARNPTCASRMPSSTSLSTTPPSDSSTGSRTPPDSSCVQPDALKAPTAVFQVPPENMIYSAHYGYVYCMALLPSNREGSDDHPLHRGRGQSLQLVTGSGDSTVKVNRLASE